MKTAKLLALLTTIALCVVLAVSVCAAEPVAMWDFADSTDGTIYNADGTLVKSPSCMDGAYDAEEACYYAEVNGGDPFISLPSRGEFSADNHYVKVKYKLTGLNNWSTSIYFTTDTVNWSETGHFVTFYDGDDDEWCEQIFDMSECAAWAGTVKEMRLDIFDGGEVGQTLKVAYAAVFATLEDAEAFDYAAYRTTAAPANSIAAPAETTASGSDAAEPTIYATKGTPKIDGVKDDVYAAEPAFIGVLNDGSASKSTTGDVYAAWDDSYMYFLFDITDAVITESGTTGDYRSDSVEVYFNLDNEDGALSELVGSGQYTFGPGFTAWAGGGAHQTFYAEDSQAEYKITDKGYTIEMAIPIGDDYPITDGMTVPFCAMINDSSAAGTRDNQYMISGGQGDAWSTVSAALWNTICFTTAAPVAEPAAEPAEEPAAEPETTAEEPAAEPEAPAAEPETVEPAETEAPAKAETTADAPQTFDFGVIAAIVSIVSLAGCAVAKKNH
ncbi:MAG: sugar-binding protein [Eubacteriales bacterium]